MQTTNRLLDDLARVANGALATMVGVKDEIQAMVRQQVERMMAKADAVPRDEFEAVKAMAAKARSEQERLERRVANLEAKLKGRSSGAGAGKKRTAATPRARATRTPAKSRRRSRR
ncbi:MAG: accessory factor UbiK family protein [Rhodospirillales bacterium]|nr:accessory factor UbiK family protein [Rhodospirillales bacterium]